MITEFAPAKINLALHVVGQRDDGYHLLDSIVMFADVGDVITVEPSQSLSLAIEGSFSDGLSMDEDNLVLQAARQLDPVKTAAITLTKNLPIASGIGGGSADAAATFRALSKLWSLDMPSLDAVADLGADIPVCLPNKPATLRGVGEDISFLRDIPEFPCVLVNPKVAVSTPMVFKSLGQKENPPLPPLNGKLSVAYLRDCRNDLQDPACQAILEIGAVLAELKFTNPVLHRMSGSGATCFGIYETPDMARRAAQEITDRNPNWWVKQTVLLGT